MVLAAGLLSTAYIAHEATAYPWGYGTNGTGCNCHNPSQTTVTTISTNATSIQAGKEYDFTITVESPDHQGAGFDLFAGEGEVAGETGTTKYGTGGLTHSEPRVFENGKATWSFKYKAPEAVGSYTIRAVGNAVNLNNQPEGDGWRSATPFVVNVVAASVKRNDIVEHVTISPNPAREFVAIKFMQKKAGEITYQLLSTNGIVVASEAGRASTVGTIEHRLSIASIPSGAYLLRILSGAEVVHEAKISVIH